MIKDQVIKTSQAKKYISNLNTEQKNNILKAIISNLNKNTNNIIQSNKKDIDSAKQNNLSAALIDRLTVTNSTIDGMCSSLDKIINLPDPCNQTLDTIEHQNNLIIKKISVPIGVIAIIYESRPNVTLDAAALCIKSGNCVILKGGKEAIYTNIALYNCIKQAFGDNNLDYNIVQFIDSTDRSDTLELLKYDNYIDIVIPRGGAGLISFIYNNTNIPVLKHLDGICHTYIDKQADINMACNIIINAKCQRPGVCNAMETLLVHQDIAEELYEKLVPLLADSKVNIRACDKSYELIKNYSSINLEHATEQDWSTEYVDLILSIKIINNLEQSIEHINHYGSHHSDAIITNDNDAAEEFLNNIDSATVYHNASTRFTDGEEFGMGAEMGISTDKLHARGPVGLKELTIYKYKIYGDGQIK